MKNKFYIIIIKEENRELSQLLTSKPNINVKNLLLI
jgi:hypothetical protein